MANLNMLRVSWRERGQLTIHMYGQRAVLGAFTDYKSGSGTSRGVMLGMLIQHWLCYRRYPESRCITLFGADEQQRQTMPNDQPDGAEGLEALLRDLVTKAYSFLKLTERDEIAKTDAYRALARANDEATLKLADLRSARGTL